MLFSWQAGLLSLYKILSAGETLTTTPPVDAASAWRRLSSDVDPAISPFDWLPIEATSTTGGWLCKQKALLALPCTSSQASQILVLPPPTAALLRGFSPRHRTFSAPLVHTAKHQPFHNAEKAGVPRLKPFKMKGCAQQQHLYLDRVLSTS